MILGDVSKSLTRLRGMKETARKEVIEYIKTSINPAADPSEKIDTFLEYFAIMPVDLDPQGIIRKLDHVMRTKDERIRSEIKRMVWGENCICSKQKGLQAASVGPVRQCTDWFHYLA